MKLVQAFTHWVWLHDAWLGDARILLGLEGRGRTVRSACLTMAGAIGQEATCGDEQPRCLNLTKAFGRDGFESLAIPLVSLQAIQEAVKSCLAKVARDK
jgi:hypothetical protein